MISIFKVSSGEWALNEVVEGHFGVKTEAGGGSYQHNFLSSWEDVVKMMLVDQEERGERTDVSLDAQREVEVEREEGSLPTKLLLNTP